MPPTPGGKTLNELVASLRTNLAREKEKGLDAPAVSDERRKELKAKARAEIQQRLDEKRKRRRLLRGNESDVHRTL